ncbi:TonB-dependent receptor [Telluribacter humicola]|uniref:TonB-dependent receptor n=1 Tax=Telluribacter humicola TaxID=1720261 RepID=UPI001A962B4C|nr:TonB-dependent receptor [Telluribacter humicola]
MKTHLLWTIICFLLVSQAQAQYILSGKVLHEENQEPVIGAAVFIPELRMGSTTDVEGKYRIGSIPKGNYTIQVSYMSHRTLIEKITMVHDSVRNFTMQNAPNALEEVIVTGAATRTLVRESPVPIATLSRVQWLRGSSMNLTDAISKLPGVSQVTTGAGLSKPVIRGLAFNRVITMHDGVRQEDNQWGAEHGINLDEFSIERFEVIRGAGSLMYGSDGLGGVMAVYSPRPVEEGKLEGRLLTNYQTNNGMYAVSAQAGGTRNGFTWLAQASRRNAGNYRNAVDGRVYGSNYRESLNLNGFVGVNRAWGYTRFYALRSTQEYNITNGTRDSLGRFTKEVYRNNDVREVAVSEADLLSRSMNPSNSQYLLNYKLTSSSFLQFNQRSSLTVTASYAQNRRLEYGTVEAPWVPDLSLFLETGYYDVRYNVAASEKWELNMGTNGMYQSMENRGTESLYPNYSMFDNGLFVFSKYSLDRLKLSGGLRYDMRKLDIAKLYVDAEGRFQTSPEGAVSVRFPGFDQLYKNLSGSMGAVYTIHKKLLVRMNASRGFRAPIVPELSSNGEHAGTFRYEIGKLDAVPEVAWQGDLGFTYESNSWYADVSLFQNNIQNFTYSERVLSQSGADSIIAGVPVFRYVQGDARLRGIEGTLTYNPEQARWVSLTLSHSTVIGRNLSAREADAEYLPLMPAPRWFVQLRLSKDRLGNRFRNLYVSMDWERFLTQRKALLAYNTETITPGYGLVHLGFGGDVIGKSQRTIFSVYVVTTNLFDRVYQSHQSRFKYLDLNPLTGRRGVFDMGRNLSLKLVVPFSTNWK